MSAYGFAVFAPVDTRKSFEENKINFDVLADLTDGDLRELGVSLGDTRRLLKAIAEQPHSNLANDPRPIDAGCTTAQSPRRVDSAERRPITVMFCDLVGSTELAVALDVEDWRYLVNCLSRRGITGGDWARRPCTQNAWRWADGSLRLSAGARE